MVCSSLEVTLIKRDEQLKIIIFGSLGFFDRVHLFTSQDENDENYEEVEGEAADVFDSDFDDDVIISSSL